MTPPLKPFGTILPWYSGSIGRAFSSVSMMPRVAQAVMHTQRNIFDILLNQPKIRLYLLTIFRLICILTNVRLIPNQSENGKYNLISGWFNKTSKRFRCVYEWSPDWRRFRILELVPEFLESFELEFSSLGHFFFHWRDPLQPLGTLLPWCKSCFVGWALYQDLIWPRDDSPSAGYRPNRCTDSNRQFVPVITFIHLTALI